MTKPVRNMYNEAKNNKEFDAEMKERDPIGYVSPSMFWGEIEKHLYASVYYGWLLAKDKYNRENYI